MMIVEQMLKNAPNPLLHIADVSGSALFQGDCLDIMPLIPDKSVQLILADLPYGTTACKWDSIIDLDLLWKQYKRIIKDNGAIVLTASQPFTTKLISSNYEMFKYEWIWKKENATGFQLANVMPLKSHENILVFSKGFTYPNTKNKMIYNPQGIELNTKKRAKRGNKGSYLTDSGCKTDEYVPKYKKYPKSVLEINTERKKGNHPTQKPLELMKYLISTYSNENDMVLDNTMGSGTTCLAAKELNRKFIGIEKEPKYYEIACQRCGF